MLVLHTAVSTWPVIIPVMVLPDGRNLLRSQFVFGTLDLTAAALLSCAVRVKVNDFRSAPCPTP